MTDASVQGWFMGQQLGWGRRYLMVRPDHFRIDYVINPYMSTQDQPDPELAMRQWSSLRLAIIDAGGEVEVLEQRPDSPDMVYAMNLGLATAPTEEAPGGRATLSHMRFEPRRKESVTAASWFTGHGFALDRTGGEGVGPHFESGDAFFFGDSLVVGYGPRTEEDALKHLATGWNIRSARSTAPTRWSTHPLSTRPARPSCSASCRTRSCSPTRRRSRSAATPWS
jgi:N-dimethylarginine dimethylaminohydrolase